MRHGARFFLQQFFQAPRSIGAAFPSSASLGEAMLQPVDFNRLKNIVEFGPGTGPFTRLIAERLTPAQRYLGIELNDAFYRSLLDQFPTLTFEQGSVEDLGQILGKHGIGPVDAIICGLPWASLPVAFQERIFAEIAHSLAPGGVFVTFAYLQGLCLPAAWALRRRLRQGFASVTHTPIVWANLPPAFAYVCRN